MSQQPVDSIFTDLEYDHQLTFATKGQRFANFMVDLVAFFAFRFVFGVLLGVIIALLGIDIDGTFLLAEGSDARWKRRLLALVVYVLIYTLMEGLTRGRSLGKLVTGTKVVTEDGDPINWKHAFLRSVYRLVPFEAISITGGLPAAHDIWTRTMVVKKRS